MTKHLALRLLEVFYRIIWTAYTRMEKEQLPETLEERTVTFEFLLSMRMWLDFHRKVRGGKWR